MKHDQPNILLVNPWIHDFAAYDFWAKPLGLLYLAAILRAHGYPVSYIDCLDRFHPQAPRSDPRARFGRGAYLKTPLAKPAVLGDVRRKFSRYGIKPEWFRASLQSVSRPDLILMTSMMTYWYPGVRETVEHVRRVFPDTPLILGGIYASLCPDHAAAHTGADQVIPGPAEKEFFRLTAAFTGLAVRPQFDLEQPDTLPYPAFDLQHRINYIPLLTSRGCPFSCAYCASRILTPSFTRRAPASVAEEVAYWHCSEGAVDFVLYDDAFLVDPETHAIPFLEAVAALRFPKRFHTPNAVHIRGITAETAKWMFAAGFQTLRLGLETVGFETRGDLDRKVTAAEFRDAVSHLKRAGFRKEQVGAYLLAGLPGQSVDSVQTAIQTVMESGITPVLAYYSPIPRTALWETAVAASRYDLTADPIFSNNAIFPCWKDPFSWRTISELKQLVKPGA